MLASAEEGEPDLWNHTPENHPVVFSTDEQFLAGMTILAVCAKMYPEIKIYAFQLMSNHIHLVVGSDRQTIQDFFAYYVERYVKLAGKAIGNASLRALMHTKASDKFYCLKIVDGFVSPLEFLNIETAGHQWFKALDISKIDLGTGKHLFAESGRYISKYQITIPAELADYE